MATPNLNRLGLTFQSETPDGNCWFYAVARQLYGDPSKAGVLRRELADYFDRVARDPKASERFVYPNGKYDVNASGAIRYANRNMPSLDLKKGDPIPAMSLYSELIQIQGFKPPAKGEAATEQEIVKAYANSLRSGMYAGDIESALIHRLYGVIVRIFTRRGADVIHTRSFDSIPDWAERPDFYRRCFPPECINLLYNGINHYDSLLLDPLASEAASFGMNVNTYRKAKGYAKQVENNTRRRKKNAVIARVLQNFPGRENIVEEMVKKNTHFMDTNVRSSFLREKAKELGLANRDALGKIYNTTAGGKRSSKRSSKRRTRRA